MNDPECLGEAITVRTHTVDFCTYSVRVFRRGMIATRSTDSLPSLRSFSDIAADTIESSMHKSSDTMSVASLVHMLCEPKPGADDLHDLVSIYGLTFDANLIACALQESGATGNCVVGVCLSGHVHVRGVGWRIVVAGVRNDDSHKMRPCL